MVVLTVAQRAEIESRSPGATIIRSQRLGTGREIQVIIRPRGSHIGQEQIFKIQPSGIAVRTGGFVSEAEARFAEREVAKLPSKRAPVTLVQQRLIQAQQRRAQAVREQVIRPGTFERTVEARIPLGARARPGDITPVEVTTVELKAPTLIKGLGGIGTFIVSPVPRERLRDIGRVLFGPLEPLLPEQLTTEERRRLRAVEGAERVPVVGDILKGVEFQEIARVTQARQKVASRIATEQIAKLREQGFEVEVTEVQPKVLQPLAVEEFAAEKYTKKYIPPFPTFAELPKPVQTGIKIAITPPAIAFELGFRPPIRPGQIPRTIERIITDVEDIPEFAFAIPAEAVRFIREEPIKAAGLFVVSAGVGRALVPIGKVVAGTEKLIKPFLPKILSVPLATLTPPLAKIVGPRLTTLGVIKALPAIALTGVIVVPTALKVKAAPTAELKGRVVGLAATQLAIAGTGVFLGVSSRGVLRQVKLRFDLLTGRKEFVPLETLVRKSVISGKETFPTAPPRKQKGLFLESEFLLPGEKAAVTKEGGVRFFSVSPEEFEFLSKDIVPITVGRGRPGEPLGLFTSPEVSPFFARLPRARGLGVRILPQVGGKPVVIRGVARAGIIDIPEEFFTQQRLFSLEIAKPEQLFVPKLSSELEAILPPILTGLGPAKPVKFVTAIRGVLTPIVERETVTLAGRAIVTEFLAKDILTPSGDLTRAAVSFSPTPAAAPIVAAVSSFESSIISRAPPSLDFKVTRVTPREVAPRELSIRELVSEPLPSRPSVGRLDRPSRAAARRGAMTEILPREIIEDIPLGREFPSEIFRPSRGRGRPGPPFVPTRVPTDEFIGEQFIFGFDRRPTKIKKKKKRVSVREGLFFTPDFTSKALGITGSLKDIDKFTRNITGFELRPVLR